MASNFPTSLDSFTNPFSGDKLDSPSHSTQHADANDAIEGLETKIGIGASPAGSATAGYAFVHSSGGTTAWSQVGYEGITSGTATSGQVLTAGTATGTTTWSTPVVDNTAWTTFTPSWTNLTVGNGTYNYAKYKQIGKSVLFAISFAFGSTTSVAGNPLSLTLPFNRSSTSFTGNFMGNCIDAGVANYPMTINMNTGDASLIIIRIIGAGGTYGLASEITSTVPFTWATNDRLEISGIYESV